MIKIIHIMKAMAKTKYRIRVVSSLIQASEVYEDCDTYSEAVERFLFYVHLAMEFSLSVRCVNLLRGSRSIKLFQNH